MGTPRRRAYRSPRPRSSRCYDAPVIERCGPLLLVLATAGCIVWPAGSGPGAAPIAAAEALKMMITGDPVPAERAKELGIVTHHYVGEEPFLEFLREMETL